MFKYDNDWNIVVDDFNNVELNEDFNAEVTINTVKYEVSEDTACISHAILLLVDAVKEKR